MGVEFMFSKMYIHAEYRLMSFDKCINWGLPLIKIKYWKVPRKFPLALLFLIMTL